MDRGLASLLKRLQQEYPQRSEQKSVVAEFQKIFGEGVGERVLEDLRRFCFVYDTTQVHGSPYDTGVNEGRRQVFIHIARMLQLTPEMLNRHAEGNVDPRDAERPPIDND